MRLISRCLVVLAVAAGLALPATVMAAPQGDVSAQHDHANAAPTAQSAAPAVGRQDMMARMKVLDDRIKSLTADMNMFVGDMKVQTMASLLTAMVQRQSMMRDEMMTMRDGMMKMGSMMHMGSMMDKSSMMPNGADRQAPRDEEPGKMCAPDAAGSW